MAGCAVPPGGGRLLNARHHLYDAAHRAEAAALRGLAGAAGGVRGEGWSVRRMFLTADGEAGAPVGNYTISINPTDGTIFAMVLPDPLRREYANAPRGRYVLDAAASFNHRGGQWASGSPRAPQSGSDITYEPGTRTLVPGRVLVHRDQGTEGLCPCPWRTLSRASGARGGCERRSPGRLGLDPHGNPVGSAHTILFFELSGLPATTRDARLREAISRLLHLAQQHRRPRGPERVENLDFADARATGRESWAGAGAARP